MAVNINFLAGKEQNVNNVPLQQGKVLFAVDQELDGDFIGYIYYDYYDPDLKKVIRVSMGSGGGSTANNPILSIADILGNIGDEVATANVTKATLQLPKIIEAEYFGAHTNLILSDIATITKPQSRLYSNGLLLFDPAAISKQGWLRMQSANDKISILELAMADSQTENGISNLNKIVARLYNKEGEVAKEAVLLDLNGSTTFPGPVYSEWFIGDLQGNASSATNAENDESGNNIAFNYLVTLQDNTLNANTYLIDLITGNGRVSKTIEIPAATEETTGLITATTQTLAGWKTLQGYLIFPWMIEDSDNQEDLSFNITNRYEYDYKKTGVSGYFSSFDDFWQITGHQNTEGTGYLEISVGNTGEEPVYLTRYTLDANQNPLLSEVITLMDKNAGSVFRRLIIIDDDETMESNLDYGLYVEEETGLYGNLYTSGSVRFEAGGEKNSLFYIVPNEDLGIKYSTIDLLGEAARYIDTEIPYYAYLKSLYLQENLEINGLTIFNDTLITKNILPDMNDTYSIGRGIPEEGPDDNYYLNSFIRNMYSNKIIVQGPVEDIEGLQADSTNPHILFRQNNEGSISDPAYLYYTNFSQGDTYVGYHGLRLTGYTRPWFDVDGAIYSRYDNEKYISILADNHSNELLLTNCGPLMEGNLQHLKVDDNSTRLYLQREQDGQYIDLETSNVGFSNRIFSNRTWGAKTSFFLSEITDGNAILINQATDETFMSLEALQGQSNIITIQATENSYINIHNNTATGLDLYVQQSDNNYFNLFNDNTYGYNFSAYIHNSMLLNSLSRTRYELNTMIDSAIYGNMVVSEESGSFLSLSTQNNDTYLDLRTSSGNNAYLYLNNGENYWSIFTTSNVANDYTGALQFKLNHSEYSRIIFANDTSTGIELFGNAPYIDFHFNRSTDDYTTRIQAVAPATTLVNGTLSISGQVIIPDENTTAIQTGGAGAFVVGKLESKHLAFDNYSINAKFGHTSSSTLHLNRNGGRVVIGEGGLTVGSEDIIDGNDQLYVKGSAHIAGHLEIDDSLTLRGGLQVQGKTVLHDELSVGNNLTLKGNLLPYSHDTYDIGSAKDHWREVYAKTFYGELRGIADSALIANALSHSFTIRINANSYSFDGSRDLSFQFYAPQGPAAKNQYVLYWDNGTPTWGDPNWVVPEPDPSDSGYVRKIGDQMSGLLILDVGARIGTSVYLDGKDFCTFGIQGSSNISETTLRLRATSGSQYSGYADFIYDTKHHNFLRMTRGLCISDSATDYPGQIRLINRETEKGVYIHNNGINLRFGITNADDPYSYSAALDKIPISINLKTGIVDCQYGIRGAVWNDYAEYRESDELEPGRCVYEVGDDSLTRTIERLMPGCNIVSDTFGFAQGETDKAKTPIATAGRVLAYTYEHRDSFEPGDAVCSGPNGTVSKMTREEIREWPDRIVGTVSCVPTYEYWGENNKVKVNGRIWIKVK